MKNEVGQIDSYSKHEVIDGMLVKKHFRVEVTFAKEIEQVTGQAKVTHTGSYGFFKFEFEGTIFTANGNPFTFWYGNVEDRRETKPDQYYAESEDGSRVISLNGLAFNLTPLTMSQIHSKIFIANYRNSNGKYWFEVPEDTNFDNCI